MVKVLAENSGHFKAMQEITQSISSDCAMDVLCQRIVDAVVRVTAADACLMYLLDAAGGNLVLAASKNPLPPNSRSIRLKIGEGITGWVGREKKPLAIAERAYEDSRFKLFSSLPEDRYEAFLSVPIIFKGRTTSVINVQHKNPHKYSANTVKLITTIAKQVGGVIEHARLYEETKKKSCAV